MQWLLDTCVVSEMTRSAPHEGVVRWLSQHGVQSALPIVALGEIQYGIERLAPGRRRNTLQTWFDGLCADYAVRTLPADEAVWRTFARLKASVDAIGRPQEDFDLLIAATAAVHRLGIVTRNTRPFEDTGIPTVNPWSSH